MLRLHLYTPYRDKKTGLLVIYDRRVAISQKKLNLFSWLIISLASLGIFVNFVLLHFPVYSRPEPTEEAPKIINSKKTQATQDWLKKNGLPPAASLEFSLIIPKISLNTKIIPNVSPADEKEISQRLKNGIGHASGSSFPNQPGTTYLFGHSSVYPWEKVDPRILLSELNNLEKQDEVFIVYQNEIYRYSVLEKTIVNADDVSYLNYDQIEGALILQTCWPPETNWKRLLVFAQPVK